jgi:hypothetical protein
MKRQFSRLNDKKADLTILTLRYDPGMEEPEKTSGFGS